jgi:quercetin dioxygenase-like cupin family protein
MVEFSQMSRHSGEEFIYVLRGPVEVHTEHYAPTVLATGDAMYLDSTMAHAFLAMGDTDALMLNVCHSPSAGHVQTLVELARARAVDRGSAEEDGSS